MRRRHFIGFNTQLLDLALEETAISQAISLFEVTMVTVEMRNNLLFRFRTFVYFFIQFFHPFTSEDVIGTQNNPFQYNFLLQMKVGTSLIIYGLHLCLSIKGKSEKKNDKVDIELELNLPSYPNKIYVNQIEDPHKTKIFVSPASPCSRPGSYPGCPNLTRTSLHPC